MKKILAVILTLSLLCMCAAPAIAAQPYTPGSYTAQAQGFGGSVSVTITVDGQTLTAVEVVTQDETPSIGGEAANTLAQAIRAANGVEGVEAVSGATVTSTAVLKAAADALVLAAGGELTGPEASSVADGVYEASAKSYKRSGSDKDSVTIKVTMKDNQVEAIDVVDYGDTAAIGGMAYDILAKNVLDTQSLGVDSITGATVSSAGFIAAMSDAITQAGGNADEWKARPIEQRDAQTVEMTADIVVVGAGIAGLSAAMEAANLGANVILVEKQAVLGSSTTRSEGYIQAANTQLQRDNGVEDTVESLYEDIMQVYASEPMVEPELIKHAAYESTSLIEFMTEEGVPFNHLEAISKNPPRNVPRNHCVEGGGGGITASLYKSLTEAGATVLMATPCTDLIMDGNAVVGIKAVNEYGDDITIHAQSVILCAGSYTSNSELFAELHPLLQPESISGSGDGDAYYLAMQANADIVKLDYVQMMYYFFSQKLTGWPSVIPGAPQTSAIVPATDCIYLTGGGERVANEDEFCFDYIEKNWEGRYTEGWALMGETFAKEHPDVIEIAMSSELGSREGKMGYTSDSIEELAGMVGLDASVLSATLERYNELCDKGVDEDFNKPAEYMKRVDAPYYLLRMPMVCTDGYDGARININAQVIDVNGEIIPGFYAAGSCAVGQMSSVRYYGCGTSLLIGGVYGRTAAQHAVSLLEK